MGDARSRGQRNQNDSDASDIVIRNDKGESNEYDEVDHTRIKAPLSQITIALKLLTFPIVYKNTWINAVIREIFAKFAKSNSNYQQS